MVQTETTFTNFAGIRSRTFGVSLIMEFVGVMIFSFLGSTVTGEMTPWVNGLALAVLIYAAANISGGHLNPAVTLSTVLCGFYPLIHAALYIVLQCVGAICGSLLAAGLLPGTTIGMGKTGPGCFDISPAAAKAGLTRGQVFGWEVVMTFTLISAVYACGVAKPGHGSFTPLVVGLTLVACAGTGGKWTGGALNPARVVGPAAVFKCSKNIWWVYILAQLLAALLACAVFIIVSGPGPLFPFKSMKDFNLSHAEAVHMLITGQPPKRLRQNDDDDATDIMDRVAEKKAAAKDVSDARAARDV
ncbi:MAG: aquaporin-like protein [Monoraphidium minutum]|nr:MAG: aquaporin-like protein [Monoraphidium minutum]